MISLNSCVTENYETNNCFWPYAGQKVQEELKNLSEDEYPALWEWFARLAKLHDACYKN